MTQGNVLIVDDNHLNRTLLAAGIEEEGYSVKTAANGKQALAMLQAEPFDVMLLDLIMPEMDGYEVLAETRRHAELRHIPVIVISALGEMESVIRCIEMGATDYLTKPFDPVLLRARMNASMASKRLHDAELAHTKEIQHEQERADRLLLNILPQPIAERLKKGEQDIVQYFPDVSVLFADIVDFTPWAAEKTPFEVLEVLNTVFSAFDRLVDKFGAEKIKTIGDSYMTACGLPITCTDHLERIADLALEMQIAYRELPIIRREKLDLRIGINSGPVIAGVIGQKKFTYDLWGDTVNTASRMQTHSEQGQIQVSENVYDRLFDKYTFINKGAIHVKSKGFMQAFLLSGKK